MSSSKNKLALFVAFRYLFARKSHNVINVISAISTVGMAIGTAALILILSVYNGFDKIIRDNLSDLDPDILLCSKTDKFFSPSGEDLDCLYGNPLISSICPVLEDNVFFTYASSQGIARARGVDVLYEEVSSLGSHLSDGKFSLYEGDVAKAAIGATLAATNGMRPHFLDALTLYYPDPDGRISIANPTSSLNEQRLWPSCIFSVGSNVDAELIVVPLEVMEKLTGSEDRLTGIEIRLNDGSRQGVRKFIKECRLEGDYRLLNRYMQHPSLYKMMRYEKFAIFLILAFVVLIVAFNIFGSLSMLMIEKKEDTLSLQAMGASKRLTSRIFVCEGWMVSLLGMAIGLVAGIFLCLVQQTLGIIKMPSGFMITAYPVVLKLTDILAAAGTVAAIGLIISLVAVKRNQPR